MIVVADSSPLIVLIKIGHEGVLPRLFEQLVIPSQVALELTSPKWPHAVRGFASKPPNWMQVRVPISDERLTICMRVRLPRSLWLVSFEQIC